MPYLNTYNLFISHAWIRDNEYDRLEALLKEVSYFQFKNYSVPKDDPLVNKSGDFLSKKELRERLYYQIKPTHCVLVIAAMYIKHREWIQIEIDIAKEYSKPIIGIAPQSQERIPLEIQDCSKEIVRWNKDSIVTAIKKHSIS